MPLRYTARILDHLSREDGRQATVHELARALRAQGADKALMREAMKALLEEGAIEESGEHIRLPAVGEEVIGTYRGTRRGFGFVVPDSPVREGDIYIPKGAAEGAISGDRVRCGVARRHGWKGGSPAGRIIEVIEQGQTTFAGTVVQRKGGWLVEPDGRQLREPVIIRDPGAKSIKVGDKVVFDLLVPPDGDYLGEGVVTEVLGVAGEPDVETAAVIAAHGLRTEFPQEVIREAKEASGLVEDAGPHREDLRDLVTFTIDPPDAKDFDDAISITWDDASEEWELGIHIADVAHFVRVGTALDEEARARGNSTYLPRLVIPMLPEILSNGVCSLQEGVDRCAKSVFVRIDRRGRVQDTRFRATVINSDKRFTYLEAQAWIEGDGKAARKESRTDTEPTEAVLHAVREADRLARVIRKRRLRDGMIVLNLPDSVLSFGEDGRVADVQQEDNAFTHTIIEMFMVEANEAVSRLFDALRTPILRRIHPEPALEDLAELRMKAGAAGFNVPDDATRHDLQQLLDATRDHPSARAVHFAVLRTLTKAEYSPAIVGHFALASEHYAHFTSPIRRYPDLVVHRALEAVLEHTSNGQARFTGRRRSELEQLMRDDDRPLPQDELIALGRHCTETEGNSEAAERSLREFLVLQHLSEHYLGEELPAVISGFNPGGLWVSLDRFLVDGQVTWDNFGTARRDRWVELQGQGRMVAKGSGAVIAVGDPVTVQLVKVDPTSRHMDLLLKDRPDRSAADLPRGPRERQGKSRKPRSHKRSRGGKRRRR
ncbi:MAG: VacB/RNase II family 3'-5' exoribonuclease [Phycisphaerales bacterium]|jgi:ribonuclease R|nr:VacB/RNase II family 3'-5' exoribonuclease [Phycisphaerales bacterium]